jgi:hypothetical protein
MGHPSLYRYGYVHGRELFLSDWRSAEPQRMVTLLNRHMPWTAQAHFIRETLALASVDPDDFEKFIEQRRKPTVKTVVMNFVRWMQDPFDALARIFMPGIVLEDDSVHGCL